MPVHSERQWNHPAVSVIIPAKNEEAVLGRCLESLSRMNTPRADFEVIVVDNGSTDRTREIAAASQPSLQIRLLEKPDAYISAVRNCGAAAARGALIAFLDADCLAPPTWLADATALSWDEEVGVVGSYYEIPPESSWVARAWYRDEHSQKHGPVSFVPGGDLLISRAAFLKVGGFDETIETNEDYEFCQRVLAAGLTVQAIPQLGVVHLGTPQTLLDFYRKQRWQGRNVLQVFMRNIRKLPNARAVFFALYTLLCLAGLAVGVLLAVLSGRGGLLLLSLLGLLLAPLVLSVRTAVLRGGWTDSFALVVLFLTYGIARARCLLDLRRHARGTALQATNIHE